MKPAKLILTLFSVTALFINIARAQVPPLVDTVCVGTTGKTYSVTNTPGSTYQWAVTGTGNTIIGTGSSIQVDWSSVPGIDTLSVIETNQFGCVGDPRYLPVLRIPFPVSEAGVDGLICEGGNYIISTATASDYSALNWYTSGSGSFLNNGTLSPTYIPSPADIASGTVKLFLEAIGNTPCGNALDSMTLTITPFPLAYAGTDQTICQGNTLAILTASASNYSDLEWITLGSGSFNNANIINPIYTPSAADIAAGSVRLVLTAIGLNPCGPVLDTMTLFITPLPIADAGNDASICEGDDYTIISASAQNYSSLIWSTSGSGSFINSGTLTPTYTPSAADISAGTVKLYLTANGLTPCGNALDSMLLTIVPAPIANAGINDTICEGNTFTVTTASAANYSSVLWTSTGTGSFVNANTLNPVYTPSAADISAGMIRLILTVNGNTPCNQAIDTMELSITPLPIANAGIDDIICEGSTYNVSTASASNYNSINWTTTGTGTFTNNGTTTPTYTPSAADIANGFVRLVLTAFGNSPCSNTTDTMVLTITPAPVVSAGPNDTICEGGVFTITQATAANYSNLQWTTSGSGTLMNANSLTPTYIPSAADITNGSVTLTLTVQGNPPCASVQGTMTLIIHPKPVTSPIFNF